MSRAARLVQRIHFEDFGGAEFERLVFAYHVRDGWTDLAWYGQAGGDDGRDIIGNERLDDGTIRPGVIQCVNRSSLTQAKAERDISRAGAASSKLSAFKFVVRGAVSATRRDAVAKVAAAAGISSLTIWSDPEFEEHLRLIGEDLLRRFCDGETFPDRPEELRRFADDFPSLTDFEVLQQMAVVFERPAFQTPFHQESSLPAFQTAIEDTISALNTGVWRARDGSVIRKIPSVHHLRDPQIKESVRSAIRLVDAVRRIFVTGLRDKTIRPCGCGQLDCPTFMLDRDVAEALDTARSQALDTFREAHRQFDGRIA